MLWNDNRPTWSSIKIAIVALVVVGAVMAIGVFGFGWFQRATADFRGKTDQIEKIQANGDYRIAQYNHFYDLCAGVQSDEASIGNLKVELSGDTDAQRKLVVQASITALQNHRAQTINQYNADARKSATAGQFRASDLPFQLSLGSEHTQCTA